MPLSASLSRQSGRKRSAAMQIAVLADNSALPGFESEHGLSLALFLADGALWLWDTGQSDLFLRQARQMGLDLAQARGVALSHGHYDHTGGLEHLLRLPGFQGEVAAHPGFALIRYRAREQSLGCDIANPCPPPLLGACRLRLVHSLARLDEGLFMLAHIPRNPGKIECTDGMCLDPEGLWPDPVPDDACLVLPRRRGLGVILGCCHSGLANTLDYVRRCFGNDPLEFVLGGLHLSGSGPEAFRDTLRALRENDVAAVYPAHCTGREAVEFLSREFPGEVRPLAAGMVLEV